MPWYSLLMSSCVLSSLLMLACNGDAGEQIDVPSWVHNFPANETLNVSAFLMRAHRLKEGGVREQHRDTLRAYQTAARLLCDGAEVYPGEGELGNALLQIYMGSLDAAVRHWESAAPPSPRVEMVQISIPKAVHTGELAQSRRAAQTEDVAVEIPLQLVQEERKGPGEPMPDMQVPHHILSAMAVSICERRASMEDGCVSSAELAAAARTAAVAAAAGGKGKGGGETQQGGEESPPAAAAVASQSGGRLEDECTESVSRQLRYQYEVLYDSMLEKTPPRKVPEHLWAEFTDNGLVPVLDWYNDGSYASHYAFWPRPHLTAMQSMAERRQLGVNYPYVDEHLYTYLDDLGGRSYMQHASVVIMGSAVPWYEALALAYGAAETVTIEYNRVHYGDARMQSMLPEEYWDKAEARKRYDIAFSISSFEHDGLGRYGDPIDPNGDLQAMVEMESVLSEGGVLLLAVPVASEALVWNAHRIYGRRRLGLLLERWTVEHELGLWDGIFEARTYAPSQPLFVLRNTRPASPRVF
jgi:uncharacterized protein YciI